MGTLLAGQSAGVFGYSMLLVTINAGENALAVSAGPILGNFRAGGDVGLASYDLISAGTQADGDIAWLWSRGNLRGTYRAGGSIGSVFSYGSINASLVADEPGGTVGSVQALGSIAGSVIADASIGTVHAGGSVTATLIAPQVATPIENDASMAAAYPLPDVPVSNMAQVRTRLADRRSDLADSKAELQVKAQAVVDAVADSRAETAASIARQTSDLAQSHDELAAKAVDALVDAMFDTANDFANDRDQAQKADSETRADASEAKKDMKGEHDTAKANGESKYNESKQKTENAKAKRQEACEDAGKERSAAAKQMLDEQYRGTNWAVAMGEDALKELKQTWATALDYRHWLDYAAEAGKEKLDAMFARPRDVFALDQSQGGSLASSLYQAIGIGISDRIGLTSVLSAWWGEDPVTLEELSNTQRIFHAVKGTLELIATGVGVYRVMISFRGPCGGYIFNRCFPEDTLVMVPVEETTAAACSSGNQGGWNRTIVVGAGVSVALAIVGSIELEERRRNQENARRRAAVDGALANPRFLDALWEHARFGHG